MRDLVDFLTAEDAEKPGLSAKVRRGGPNCLEGGSVGWAIANNSARSEGVRPLAEHLQCRSHTRPELLG